ncbi:hypothetical protein [Sphingosinicella humi]|uniref:DUF4412 domain-containing protein n=1 Tax=Allosphingosinicella humi TaxID=2068657 RepID=A0A2U2J4Q7_9SPHN|nr:hypothetical protein [Sphingosinicella humi]PWG03308.1 hypothetical protein DF286_10840 [Sphingosinicella humi]
MTRLIYGILAASALCTAAPAEARKPKETWTTTRVSDPITGASSCVVAAYDRVGKMEFSRMGYLYPVVENNASLGLLVGVSSGGRFRVPTGDILWRVDQQPHRELKAADNPVTGSSLALEPFKTGNEQADRAVADAMAKTANLAASMTATSTVASGEKAREMLAEMLAGKGLIYRQATAAPAYGLPSGETYRVGQLTDDEQRPFPLDASFRKALAECGIDPSAQQAPTTATELPESPDMTQD